MSVSCWNSPLGWRTLHRCTRKTQNTTHPPLRPTWILNRRRRKQRGKSRLSWPRSKKRPRSDLHHQQTLHGRSAGISTLWKMSEMHCDTKSVQGQLDSHGHRISVFCDTGNQLWKVFHDSESVRTCFPALTSRTCTKIF